MARKKRPFTTFNLSFLDIMSCGFGAVVLVFLIIDHNSRAIPTQGDPALAQEVAQLQQDIDAERSRQAQLKNDLPAAQQQLTAKQRELSALEKKLAELEQAKAALAQSRKRDSKHIESLIAELKTLEAQIAQLRANPPKQGEKVKDYLGDGQRQYLTGLTLGGDRVVILLDVSASMLAEKLVNIIRLRNMTKATQRSAEKWQRAINTSEWLLAQLPASSRYQFYTFNTAANAILPGTKSTWLKANDAESLGRISEQLQQQLPQGGTSLINAFAALRDLQPAPDTLFLITDGLPTQGKSTPRRNKVSADQRLKLFREARRALPPGIAVNVILAPMEGDPMAAAAFWGLAQGTRGAFLSPSKDWP